MSLAKLSCTTRENIKETEKHSQRSLKNNSEIHSEVKIRYSLFR